MVKIVLGLTKFQDIWKELRKENKVLDYSNIFYDKDEKVKR